MFEIITLGYVYTLVAAEFAERIKAGEQETVLADSRQNCGNSCGNTGHLARFSS